MEDLLKNKVVASHAIAAAGSVGLATALTCPLDTLKVLVQVGSGPSGKRLSSIQALSRVRSFSGNSGLYGGLGWLASGRILGVGTRFGVYELLTAFYKDGREYTRLHFAEAIVAGMTAGAAESFISSPFELIKLRAQVASASRIPSSTSVTENKVGASVIAKLLRGFTPDKKALNQSVTLLSTLTTKHPDFVGALQNYPWMMTGSGRPPSVCDVQKPSNIISLEGVGALWKGIRSGVARDSIFGGIFFGCWQFLHEVMLVWKAVGMDPVPSTFEEIGPLSPLPVSLAAGLSGSLAAAVSHGFDTAKSRSECTVLPKYISMERRLMKWKRPGNIFERITGIHPADRNILFRGTWLRVARSGFASFVVVGSYYLAVDCLV